MKRLLLASLAMILVCSSAAAGNHALYAQLRHQAKVAYHRHQDLEMIQRERMKYARMMQQKYQRGPITLERKNNDPPIPDGLERPIPNRQGGVPKNQMRAMAEQFRLEHGQEIKLKAKR